MKVFIQLLIVYFFRCILWLRYRIKVKGLENLKSLPKNGGVLLLPNHPTVFVDPVMLTIILWQCFPVRPVVVEFMYYMPMVNWVMRLVNAVPIPHFAKTSNSLKQRSAEKAIEKIVQDMGKGDNFLLYPAGKIKQSSLEIIEGSSSLYQILQQAPEANIVLVRTKGLWGSSFSRALTGEVPPMFPTIFAGFKVILKNLLFFTPRRDVIIEFVPAPADFPFHAARLELNRYLEKWYNQPDGLTVQKGSLPGDSLVLVPYSCWTKEIPKIRDMGSKENLDDIDLDTIPKEIQQRVIDKIAFFANMAPSAINENMSLTKDLGMDSLNIAEVVSFLDDEFGVENVSIENMTTVGKVMKLAAKQMLTENIDEGQNVKFGKWNEKLPHELLKLPPNETMLEVFFYRCQQHPNQLVCADQTSGVLTYAQVKTRIILLAQYITNLPGIHIGVMLPSSVAAIITILACQLAGKIPVMVNWTLGPRHLKSVVELTKMQALLSSWSFIDRLQSVDFSGIEDIILFLEDVSNQCGIKEKVKSFLLSKRNNKAIFKNFNFDASNGDHPAVILFTSGTESHPKGVPLSHKNILSNILGATKVFDVSRDDIFFSFLPPFHSFGFTIGIFLGLLTGARVACFPNPTDAKGLVKSLTQWKPTVMLTVPIFLKGMLRIGQAEAFSSLRLCVSGAEQTPPEIMTMLERIGKESIFIEGYGVTECSPVISVNTPNHTAKGVGKPLPGSQVCVVNIETYQQLPVGTQGLILACGHNVFNGYINPDVASPFVEIDKQKWYVTGDLGVLDENGNITITGRLKRFIKIGAEMVSLSALETVLGELILKKGMSISEEGPSLAICAKEYIGEKPKIVVFTKHDITLEEANKSLKEAGFSNLAKVTAVMKEVDIPLMGTGKINYRALENKIEERVMNGKI